MQEIGTLTINKINIREYIAVKQEVDVNNTDFSQYDKYYLVSDYCWSIGYRKT